MRHLPDGHFIEEICDRYGGIPAEILREEELMKLLLPVLRADIGIKETYKYVHGSRLDCGISVFGGDRDDSVTSNELSGWRDQTAAAFNLRMFSGDHFFIHSAPFGASAGHSRRSQPDIA